MGAGVITAAMNSDFTKSVIKQMLAAIDQGIKNGYHLAWDILVSFLANHLLSVILFLALILVLATIRAFQGYWGMLGRVLYSYLFFGTLFIIGLIKGPNVFASEYLEITSIIVLYPLCYFVVGYILNRLGFRKRV